MPDEQQRRTGVLVIRAWREAERPELIARITGRTDVLDEAESSVTVAGSAAAARVALEWLEALERDGGPGDR